MPVWSAAPLTLVLLGAAWLVHRHLWGALPEDPPGKGRKSHERPTPMVGALLAPVAVGWLVAASAWWAAAGALIAAAVGTWDDVVKQRGHDLDWRLKAGALAVATGCGLVHHQGGAIDGWWWVWGALLLFAITNATNFLDNTDGVAGMLVAVGLLWATGGEGPLAAAGWVAVGFLPWNWPRPGMFLGDGGALCLGFLLGVQALEAAPVGREVAAPAAVPLIDFLQVIVARLVIGVAPWVGDRRHLTHVALHLGLPRPVVAPLFAAAATGCWWWLAGMPP